MTHASLFSGIGGFDLAAEWAGWTNAFNCEIDPFCRKVLKYHFPDAEQYEDIKKSDFSKWRDRIDVLTGGFPCQPFSLAGKRKGTEDGRYLWPAMLGVIRTVRPRWVVGENVYGIVNWSEGMVFDTVCSDLEAAGYEVQPYIIPACGVGAPHRRDRCWFVAHRADTGIKTMREGQDGLYAGEFVAHADGQRCCQFDNAALANQQRQPCRNYYAGDASDAKGKRLPERNGQSGRGRIILNSSTIR
jgi:DNA (cytosine-5)-methyltransferase 1